MDKLSIGVEEEYQIVDPESGELRSYVQEFLNRGRVVLKEQIKPEFLQSQVEVGSKICSDIDEVRKEVKRLRREVVRIAKENGLAIIAASTHPFSRWEVQDITIGARYTQLATQMADLARRMLIFGMHIHVGFEDPDLLIDVHNQIRYFLPHLLALSTSSPFWHGRNTGLKSYRSVVFENIPRTGLPPTFNSYQEFKRFVSILKRTGCIDDPTKIWWDVRPHANYKTLEVRVCDLCTDVEDLVSIVALTVSLVFKLIELRKNNQSWRIYPHHLIVENKWRAVRYGIDGKLIDFGKAKEVKFKNLVDELVSLVEDTAKKLDMWKEVSRVKEILVNGTSADKQMKVYKKTGSLKKVVDFLIKETLKGIDETD